MNKPYNPALSRDIEEALFNKWKNLPVEVQKVLGLSSSQEGYLIWKLLLQNQWMKEKLSEFYDKSNIQ